MTRPLVAVILIGFSLTAQAAEGMWRLDQLDRLDWLEMRGAGIMLGPDDVRDLAQAVVRVGGGTGAFVSKDGLVLTNHHVAFACITNNSDLDKNLLEHGFLALDRTLEIPCKGIEVQIMREMKDVTAEVQLATDAALAPLARLKARAARRNQLATACQAGRDDRRCNVARFFGGTQEMLVRSDLIRDVRLVHAPENSVADFGGDTDNFEWPRHSGDYTFLRAYTGPQGEVRAYDKTNVPYHPARYLTISLQGYAPHAPALVIGYPGSTSRYIPAAELTRRIQVTLPNLVARVERTLAIYDRHAAADPATAIKVADVRRGAANNLKRFRGQLDGLKRAAPLEARRAREKELAAFIAQDPARLKRYGGLLERIEQLSAAAARFDVQDRAFAGLTAPRSAGWAYSLVERAIERALPDDQRHDPYHERQVQAQRQRIVETPAQVVAAVEEDLLAVAIEDALALPAADRITAVDTRVAKLTGSSTQKARALAHALVTGSHMAERDTRAKLFDADRLTIDKSDDALVRFAADLAAQKRPWDDRRESEIEAALDGAQQDYMAALVEWKGKSLYPDANGTLRFTWGPVEGYVPSAGGSRRGYATTVSSLLATAGDVDHYRLSDEALAQLSGQRLSQFIDQNLGDAPVDFVFVGDTTGGNSGSPVLDGRGHLIGCAFDGNYEGLGGAFAFDPRENRSIAVDVRYVLLLTAQVYGAIDLLQELQVPGLTKN